MRNVIKITLVSMFDFLLHILIFCYFRSSKEIRGKDVTPFILQRVNELTKGKSLEASILLKSDLYLKESLHSAFIYYITILNL